MPRITTPPFVTKEQFLLRKNAMEWWNKIEVLKKVALLILTNQHNRNPDSIIGREIEDIYSKFKDLVK